MKDGSNHNSIFLKRKESTSSGVIKVGFLVSYDWKLLRNALLAIYKAADVIWLAIDTQRLSWSGNTYIFNTEEFNAFLYEVDVEKKIFVYEDNFYIPGLSPMECEVRERNMLSTKMGEGGWHIQLDADEYFIDFEGFVAYLRKLNPNPLPTQKALTVRGHWLSLVKRLPDGYLYVKDTIETVHTFSLATNVPVYVYGRNTAHFNYICPFFVIHDTWARSAEELQFKLDNWGHSTLELANPEVRRSYLELWKALDKYNYQFVKNFYFGNAGGWPALAFQSCSSIEELIAQLKPTLPSLFNSSTLFFKNSRLLAYLLIIYNRIMIILCRNK